MLLALGQCNGCLCISWVTPWRKKQPPVPRLAGKGSVLLLFQSSLLLSTCPVLAHTPPGHAKAFTPLRIKVVGAGPPCTRTFLQKSQPLFPGSSGTGAPHAHPHFQGLSGTAVLLLASLPGSHQTLMIFSCNGERSREKAGPEGMPHRWSCFLLCCWAWRYLKRRQGRQGWVRTRWTASERASGAEKSVT